MTKAGTTARRQLKLADDSLSETGGFISSISVLEEAATIEPHLLNFIHEVLLLECVSEAAKGRLEALIKKHS